MASGLAITYLVREENVQVILSDVLFPIVCFFVSGLMYYVSRKMAAQSRQMAITWAIFATGILVSGIGDTIWAWIEIKNDILPFPSISDAAYVSYYILFFIGMLVYPKQFPRHLDSLKAALDLATIVLAGICISCISWYSRFTKRSGLSRCSTQVLSWLTYRRHFTLATSVARSSSGRRNQSHASPAPGVKLQLILHGGYDLQHSRH
jgi:hypothetical protein